MRWQPRNASGRFASPYRWQMVKVPMLPRFCGRCQLLEVLRADPETFTELPNGSWGLTDWYRDRPGFKRQARPTSPPPTS